MGSHTANSCPISQVRTPVERSFFARLWSILFVLSEISYVLYVTSVPLRSTTTGTRGAYPHVQVSITLEQITAPLPKMAGVLK